MKRTGKTITFLIIKARRRAASFTPEPVCVCGNPYSQHPNERCEKPVDSGI